MAGDFQSYEKCSCFKVTVAGNGAEAQGPFVGLLLRFSLCLFPSLDTSL